jgi:hypothetical protein
MILEQLNVCATFFGALTALVIFNQWNNQKRAELLSIKAHDTYRDLNKFKAILSEYIEAHKYYLNFPKDEKVLYGKEFELFPKVKDLFDKIFSDIELIYKSNNDLKNHFNNFETIYKELDQMMFKTLERASFGKDKLSFTEDDRGDEAFRYYKIDLDSKKKDLEINIDKIKDRLVDLIFFKK